MSTSQNSCSAHPVPDELIQALQDPALYDHPVEDFSVIETHISWVILTGNFVYKIKKPVNLGFVDFSTLDKRQHFCAEELRLNRRFAPDLYLEGSQSRAVALNRAWLVMARQSNMPSRCGNFHNIICSVRTQANIV